MRHLSSAVIVVEAAAAFTRVARQRSCLLSHTKFFACKLKAADNDGDLDDSAFGDRRGAARRTFDVRARQCAKTALRLRR